MWRQPFSRTTRRGTTAGVLVGRVYKSSHGRGEKELPKWCRRLHGGDDNDNEDPRGTVIKQDGVTLNGGLVGKPQRLKKKKEKEKKKKKEVEEEEEGEEKKK